VVSFAPEELLPELQAKKNIDKTNEIRIIKWILLTLITTF